jgi:hypothetical protein
MKPRVWGLTETVEGSCEYADFVGPSRVLKADWLLAVDPLRDVIMQKSVQNI